MASSDHSKNQYLHSANKTHWTRQEILDITSGTTSYTPTPDPDHSTSNWIATGASIYSFEVQPGDLFILLSHHRTRFDFVQEAFQRGAAGALLTEFTDESSIPTDLDKTKCIFVKDANAALKTLGAFASTSNTNCTKIGITGSVGKTSTKEALVQILKSLTNPSTVHYNYLNYNNEFGVALSLVRMPRQSVDYCVFELGMSNPNEIRTLVKMVQPSIVIITCIGAAHLESFDSLEEVVDAKCEIFEVEQPQSTIAVLNADDFYFPRMQAHAIRNGIRNIVTFGEDPDSTFQLLEYSMGTLGTNVRAMQFRNQVYEYYIGQPGRAYVWNTLAVLATVHGLNLDFLEPATAELQNLKAISGRGSAHIVPIPGSSDDAKITIIDDSYNSNPKSLKNGLERMGFSKLANNGRKIVVLGDMKELGHKNELQLHLELKLILESNGIDLVFVSGELMTKLYNTLDERLKGEQSNENCTELIPKLMKVVRDGDMIYVKGSRSTNMDLIVNAFLENKF